MNRPIAPIIAATPARPRWRASHASCFSLLEVGAATSADTLVAPGLGQTNSARGLRADLVAPDDARGAVAHVEDEVQRGGGEPDQRLEAPGARELLGTAVGHGRR